MHCRHSQNMKTEFLDATEHKSYRSKKEGRLLDPYLKLSQILLSLFLQYAFKNQG